MTAETGLGLISADHIYDIYFTSIHRYLARRLGENTADDLAAEVFLTAFKRRRSFDPVKGAVRPWLFGIATNLVARHHRTETRRYNALAKAESEPVPDSEADRIAERVSAQDLRQPLGRALARLPAAERDVLPDGDGERSQLSGGRGRAVDRPRHGRLAAEPGQNPGPGGAWHRDLRI